MFQTANTVNRVPIPLSAIQQRAHRIASILQLSPQDDLVDLCCGNGLVDFELAPYVKSIVGIDFAENLIDAAQRLKQRPNIRYCIGNVTAPLSLLMGEDKLPGKFLMVSSLGYLQPWELSKILGNILQHLKGRAFQFLIAGIPNVELQAHFYDTPERVARHLENERALPDTNDGVGRWWSAEEIETICRGRGLSVHLTNQTADGMDYRMDAVISKLPSD
jgi:SAM-dependent methyltransferase